MEENQRIQSPSSILTHKQCPRKYYYQYIQKLPTKTSIHLTRGKIIHSVLEEFFKINIEEISSKEELSIIIQDKLNTLWKNNEKELNSLDLTEKELKYYFVESQQMLQNWIHRFNQKLSEDFKEDFKELIPTTEEEIVSPSLRTRGFIDAIHKTEDSIIIKDYKTSKKATITDEYKLQLAIYALLYKKKYGITPTKVGVDFLKHDEEYLDVDENLLNLAKKEIELIHLRTMSKLQEDYPKKTSPLCKWSTGQCDFYEACEPFGE